MTRAVRSILSLSALAFREAVRSRLAAAVVFAVACAIAAIRRATLSGDPAAAHNFVFYSLAAVSAVLSVSALAASAASVSGDARSKTLALVRVKPVPMPFYLAGKWLGLVALFAAVLAAAIAAVAALAGPGAPRTCFRRLPPALPPVAEVVDELVGRARQAGVADAATLARLRRDAIAKMPFTTESIGAGDTMSLPFALPRPLRASDAMALEIRFESDVYSATPLEVVCTLRNPAEPSAQQVSAAVTNITSRMMSIPFDTAPLAGATGLVLDISHSGGEGTMPVLLQPRQSAALLVSAGSQAANCVRAFAVALPVLALLVATGLALGSLFSLPVALFCAAGLVLSVFTAGYSMADPDGLSFEDLPEPTPLQAVERRVSVATVRTLDFVARTATAPEPAACLAGARLIPAGDAARSLVWNGAVLPAALLLVAAAVLKRKEMP